ncbi:MAG: prolipoprotein diacylglyceryl transferase [Clostridia bacterium]|nr:prolipoprotein diacylglyceryl transferase [Clostridia bacterium]
MHPNFDFGFFTLPAMGTCILIGTVIGLVVMFLIRRFSRLSTDNILDGLIWAVLLGFFLAKVLYWIVSPESLTLDFSSTSAFFDSLWRLIGEGMVFYGGLIGGVLGLAIVAIRKKKGFLEFTDLFAPCFCLAHAGGRFGCYFSGCCYGMECVSPISVNYPVGGVFSMRLPTQLMEAGFLILLSAALIVVLKHSKRRGTVTAWYLIAYSVWRFVIEFFRGDEARGAVGALSTSQFISFFILAAGISVLLLSRTQKQTRLMAFLTGKADPEPEGEEETAAPEEIDTQEEADSPEEVPEEAEAPEAEPDEETPTP